MTHLQHFTEEMNMIECGVVGLTTTLNISKKFFDTYINHYLKDTIWNLKDNTDCRHLTTQEV